MDTEEKICVQKRGLSMKISYLVTWGAMNGGLRVICEQTNRLIERGHQVKILTLKEEKPDWYPFKAEIITLPQFEGRIPVSDITVASFGGAALPACTVIKEIPFYLIQAYEPGLYADSEYKRVCEASYQLPLNLLCVSSWLEELLGDRFLRQAYIISNGVDLDQFKPAPPILKGTNRRILMMYSDVQIKGCLDGISAFGLARDRFPEIELIMFGDTPPPRMNFPVTFFHRPSQNELSGIYSSGDIFISTSIEEGFGLPQLEAMACGVPVVTTDSKGMRGYAIDGRTALVVPPQNPERLAEAIIRLLENDSLRSGIARAGLEKAQEFSWEKSVDRLEELFNKAMEIYSKRPPQDWHPWEKVLMMTPNDTWAHYAFGIELQRMGNMERAKEEYEKAIELNPDFPFVYRDLGKLLSEMGNSKKALYYLKIAKEKITDSL